MATSKISNHNLIQTDIGWNGLTIRVREFAGNTIITINGTVTTAISAYSYKELGFTSRGNMGSSDPKFFIDSNKLKARANIAVGTTVAETYVSYADHS